MNVADHSVGWRAGGLLLSGAARPLRFMGTGGVAAALQLTLLHGLLARGWSPVPANTAAFLLAAQMNFLLSSRFTWRDRSRGKSIARQWLLFHASISTMAIVNMLVFVSTRDFLPVAVASLAGILAGAAGNYLLGDRLVFRGAAGVTGRRHRQLEYNEGTVMHSRPTAQAILIATSVLVLLASGFVQLVAAVRTTAAPLPLFGTRRTQTSQALTVARVSIQAYQAATAPAIVTTRSAASLGPLETILETLNNCGPSSVAAVLAYWHVYRTQDEVQSVLRADSSYWGMSPVDLPAYARSLGMRALVGYGGSERLVKLLIANGFPVIASQYVASTDQIRHYRPIEAYNDRTQTFVSADPYLGAGHVISYAEFNAIWAESDYRFQVIYPPSLQSRLNAVLRAAGWKGTRAYLGAIRWEEAQMRTSAFGVPGSWIWYNGYIDIAFDEAQIGQYSRANAALNAAARQGISPVLIGWVRNDIRILQGHA